MNKVTLAVLIAILACCIALVGNATVYVVNDHRQADAAEIRRSGSIASANSLQFLCEVQNDRNTSVDKKILRRDLTNLHNIDQTIMDLGVRITPEARARFIRQAKRDIRQDKRNLVTDDPKKCHDLPFIKLVEKRYGVFITGEPGVGVG